ncbi:MAG: acetyl-CoA carboxylase biotin carboxylase subunit [Ignavibacteria bacterium]|nr:acetyl-CoA carboxylase biotin carboxylase subunit [Ignavibacteria bacterium]
MFRKVLIANRGEIAVRIIRACRELGIKSAAIYSDADKTALHTKFADESYNIGAPISSESYLNQEKIINLAKKIKADAIHPGYGFFAENAKFISAVEKAGIIFIGPSSESVELMGSKTAARQRMQKHNVPIVPGTTKPIISAVEGKNIGKEIGYPILLKAAAGGGGKGMRKINAPDDFESAFDATKRESLKAFASDEIYIEKFIEKPKHIEVQIFGDKHGNYVHLNERECSIQRRHQKIIEEAPSSFVNKETRKKITQAAIDAAKACNYYNAGTVEFLMDAQRNFFFLEMNTRLQVEHPVTELTTGFDLVKEQLSVASGKKLSFKQSEVKINGHSIECRIYAEDAENNFMPSTGKIIYYVAPSGPGIRLDSGFEIGSEISVYYDPLISKLVCWGEDRTIAIERMKRALSEYHIAGLITNISFLKLIIQQKDFNNGKFDINYLNEDFMSKISSLQNELGKEKLMEVAAIFSAIHKSKFSMNHVSSNHVDNINRWVDQLYE